MLEAVPDVCISLATSWVRTLGYEFAVQQLPAALRSRVVETIWQSWMLQFPPSRRHNAITTDAKERGVGRWLTLDDDINGWPANRRHLVVARDNPWQGLGRPGVADELSKVLELLCTGQRLEERLLVKAAILSPIKR